VSRIARELFTCGTGAQADRLALISNRLGDLGGWSLAGAATRIQRIIEDEATINRSIERLDVTDLRPPQRAKRRRKLT
jgi:electron transfer flavoprotein alpha/beta subunit